MSTRDEIDGTANLLGWSASDGTYLRGDRCVQVDYSATGHITAASWYRFFKLNDLQLVAQAGGKHKKETVLSWLAS